MKTPATTNAGSADFPSGRFSLRIKRQVTIWTRSHHATIKADGNYVDVGFTPDGLRGELLVEPGSIAIFASAAERMNVTEARANNDQRERILRDAVDRGRASVGAGFVGASYDAFENKLLVVLDRDRSDDSSAAKLEAETEIARSAIGSSIEVRRVKSTPRFHGGQSAYNSTTGGGCTTGFGVSTSSGTGYLTMGHCGSGTWNINGNVSSSVIGTDIGSYHDCEAIIAPGASWMTKISPSSEVDMDNNPLHIYLNGSYCHFGQASFNMSCGTITAVSIPVPGPPTTYAFQSTATCRPGDSSGPVWKLETNFVHTPRGMIIAGDQTVAPVNGNWPCQYVAMDDQLSGTGWTLM